ncbi:MAG: hypothetical protein ACR2QE_13300 [Acidimicrobiales bacterium]
MSRTRTDEVVTVAFVGAAPPERAGAVHAFETEVLRLMPTHGARVVFRGHRRAGQPTELPMEFHVLEFPTRAAYQAFLGDPRRAEVVERHGEVFTTKTVVEVEPILGDDPQGERP